MTLCSRPVRAVRLLKTHDLNWSVTLIPRDSAITPGLFGVTSSLRRPQSPRRLEVDMISVRKHVILYSPQTHNYTQAFFIFTQKGDVCVFVIFRHTVIRELLIGNHEIRF